MTRLARLALALAVAAPPAVAQPARGPDTVIVQSGTLALRALLFRPAGRGPFPAVLFNHGSGHGALGPAGDSVDHPMQWQGEQLGPIYARHGYVFLYLLRRGNGLSEGQGVNSVDRWRAEMTAQRTEAGNRLQLELLETVELDDALAGLAALRALPDVDPRRVAVAGHSFGGAISLLIAERDSTLRAAVNFAGAAGSWERSPALRERLLSAVAHAAVPIFHVYAANDYTVAPGRALAAEMKRRGKPHRLEIYPAFGRTAAEGHSLVHLRPAAWERDVFAFLDERTRK